MQIYSPEVTDIINYHINSIDFNTKLYQKSMKTFRRFLQIHILYIFFQIKFGIFQFPFSYIM